MPASAVPPPALPAPAGPAGSAEAGPPLLAPCAAEEQQELPAVSRLLLRRLDPWAAPALLLVAALLLALLVPLGLWDPWETRLVEQAQPLDTTGQTEPQAAERAGATAAQPPLPRWLIRGSLAVLGVHEVAVRLPGALLGLALLVVLLVVARRRWSSTVALIAAGVLLSSPHFLLQAGLSLGNMPLLACQGMAMLLLLELVQPLGRGGAGRRRRWPLLGSVAALAATLLAGGLPGLLLPTAVFGCWWLLGPGDARRRNTALALLAALAAVGLASVLAPRGSFFAALAPDLTQLLRTLPREQVTFEHVCYLIAFGFFPWSALLPAALLVLARPGPAVGSIAGGESTTRAGSGDGPLLLLWIGLGYVLASLGLRSSGSDLFLALPAAALAIGLLAAAPAAGREGRWLFAASFLLVLWVVGNGLLLDRGAWLTGLVDSSFAYPEGLRFPRWTQLPLLGLVVLLLVHVLQPDGWLQPGAWPEQLAGWVQRQRLPLWRYVCRLGLLPAALLERFPVTRSRLSAGLRRLQSPRLALPGAALCGLALALLLCGHLVPRLTHSISERSVLDAWRRAGSPAEAIGTYLVAAETSPFYLGSLPRMENRNTFLERFTSSTPAFAVIPRDRLAEVNKDFRSRTERHLAVLDDRSSRLLLVANHVPVGERDRNPVPGLLLESPPTPQHPVVARLDGSLELIGADFSRESVPVGGTVKITTYFRVLRPVNRSWKIFLHVETPSHRIETGNTDHQPTGGILPTTAWKVGDIIKDSFVLKVPFFSPIGTYQVRTGFFIGDDRMNVDTADKHDGKDRILLGDIRVTAI